ncbi:hypothetical protein PbB2_01923 [Candidatus Phycosocius bacilliformis]|uniref:Uncharacterized protein n=1 Tax=Candidatus Phycosocius bacilliformis TaxID=1445552 RepID=A0A2P2EB09_9PROT|nr:hypothetical protein [Candidatus Phycosocius bacilliformis]GBF58251.1 hypothetical protein PbB2_01923 [Candidatus Phycosocius bacilliformis]
MTKRRLFSGALILVLTVLYAEFRGLKIVACAGDDVRAVAISSSHERVYLTRIGSIFVGFPNIEGQVLVVTSDGLSEFGYFTRAGIQFESCS